MFKYLSTAYYVPGIKDTPVNKSPFKAGLLVPFMKTDHSLERLRNLPEILQLGRHAAKTQTPVCVTASVPPGKQTAH